MSTYHDYLQTLDRATGFAPPLEWLQAKPDPRTAPHLLENECRLYRTYQFNGALLIGNRRETATASYDLLSMARLEAGMNSLSSLFSESDTTCLSTTQRLMVIDSMRRVPLPLTENATESEIQKYHRAVTAISQGALTLERDDQNRRQRQEKAGRFNANVFNKTINPVALVSLRATWVGEKAVDNYQQFLDIVQWISSFHGAIPELHAQLMKMPEQLKPARNLQEMAILLAKISKIMELEKLYLARYELRTIVLGQDEGTNEDILETELVPVPLDISYSFRPDAYFINEAARLTAEEGPTKECRKKMVWAKNGGKTFGEMQAKITKAIANYQPSEVQQHQPPTQPQATVQRANTATVDPGVSSSTLASAAHVPAMQQLDMELLHADVWTPNPYPAAAATFGGDDYDQMFQHPSHSHQIQANVAGQQRRMQPDHQLEPPLQRQRLADRSPLPPTNRPPICQHFLENRCTFGSNCRMSHDTTGLQPVYMGPQQYQMYQLGQMESNQRQQQSQQREQDYGFGPLHPTGRYVQPQQQQQQQPPPTHPHFQNHWRPGNGAGGK